MIIANRGGHTEAATGACSVLNELTEDRKLYKRVQELLVEVGNTMIDCTPPESYAYPAELNYGINKCNNSNAELFYSIHFNSFSGAYGSEVCIYPGTDLTSKIGNKILKNLFDLGFRNRGLKPRTDLGELTSINCPSMIIEVCFVQSPDAEVYKSLGVENVARAIANGIDSRVSLNVSKQESEINEKKEITEPIVEKNIDVTYQVYSNGRWLPNVVNLEDYAGIYGQPIQGVYANLDKGSIKYRTHTQWGDWLPWVIDRQDYAGILGTNIDGLQMQISGLSGYNVKYRVYVGGRWLPWVMGLEDYAGIYGQAIEGIQVQVIKR
jgi:hypothetical protein